MMQRILNLTAVRMLATSHYPVWLIALAPFLALYYPEYTVPAFASAMALLAFICWVRLEFAQYVVHKSKHEEAFKTQTISYLVDIDRADLVASIMKRLTDDPDVHRRLDEVAKMKSTK